MNVRSNQKTISPKSKPALNFVMCYRGLIALLAVVALLLTMPLTKQNAQINQTAVSKQQAQYKESNLEADHSEAGSLTVSGIRKNKSVRTSGVPMTEAAGTLSTVTEVEPNNTPATATPIGTGAKIKASSIFPNGDVDYYSFTANAGDRVYAATMTSFSGGSSTDSQLTLFASDGTTVIENDNDNGTFAALSSSIAGTTIPTTGTYYLKANDFTAGTTSERPYDLWFNLQSGSPTAETESNDTSATANPLPANGWVSGTRDPALASEQDWYSVTLNAGDTVFLSLDLDPERDGTTWNGRLGFGLLGDANNQLVYADDAGSVETPGPTIPSEALFVTVKTAGTYYAYVDSVTPGVGGPTATYHLNVNVLPHAPIGVNCTTYASTDVPKTIGPGTGLNSSTITVPGNPRIASLRVSVQLNHALMGDIDAQLRSPAGNDNGLFSDIGSQAVAGQTQMNLTLDDNAATPFISTVVSPLILKPELNYRLAWFNGENAGGTWTLDLRDDTAGANGGTLTGWSMEICEQPPTPTGTAVFSTDFESGDAGFTHSGTQDEWELGLPTTLATTTANPVAAITTCNSGTNCWKTDLDSIYNINANFDLLSPNINLTSVTGTATLSWAMKYQMESANFDHATVTVRQVGNPSNSRLIWQWLDATMTNSVGNPATNIGASSGWSTFNADISDFAGQNIEVVFHVDTDNTVNFAGWAIDDVSVIANTTPTISTAPLDFDGDGKSDFAVVQSPVARLNGMKEERVLSGDLLAAERQRIWAHGYNKLLDLRTGRGFVSLPTDVEEALAISKTNSIGEFFSTEGIPMAMNWMIRRSSDGTTLNYTLGAASDVFVPADYDGDGKADAAVWNPITGFTVIHSSTLTPVTYPLGIGNTNADPTVIGDYDGDGKDDPAVYDKTTGMWSWLGGAVHNVPDSATWLANGIPAPGDYNGDGKADFAIQVPPTAVGSNAKFRIAFNDGSVGPAADIAIVYGLAIYAVVPGDYDGDGKTDIAQVNLTGTNIGWRVLTSSSNYTLQVKKNLGVVATDRTVQGDYDGDGKIDFAIYCRAAAPNDGVFIYQPITAPSPTSPFDWGNADDYPVAFFNMH